MNENAGKTPLISVLAGIAPFLLWDLILIASEIPHDWLVPGWINSFAFIMVLLIIFLPTGVGIGWVQGFPRWSYSYIPSSIFLAAYLAHASTPGLQLFGYPIFGRELWGWRAWFPLLMGLLLAILISRSLQPIIKLFSNIRRDPTLLTYSLFALMPLLVFMFFDEMDRLFSLYFMVSFAMVSIIASSLYMRRPQTRKGSTALLAGALITTFILVLGPNLYWQSHGGMNPVPSIILGIVLIIVMATPVLYHLLSPSSHNKAA